MAVSQLNSLGCFNNSPLKHGMEVCQGYRLRQLRGKGSFGMVWEAAAAQGPAVAFKFLPCDDFTMTRQEMRAIARLSQLRHAHLVPIDRVWCYERFVVAAMPLADGSLLDCLEAYQSEFGTAIPREEVCQYLSQAAEAIDYMNAHTHVLDERRVGFQHCDVKPSNLLLFEETVKVADFGLATPTGAPFVAHRRAGTPDYAAPEVMHGRLSDWTDQYSLAVSYCQLRGGRLPFPACNTLSGAVRAGPRPAPDLTMLAEPERPIVARGLAVVPQERWPNCRELMKELSKLRC
jgi:serine/threonine-protein kinase